MRCCCDEVTGGRWITLLLMIIKRTICAKPLGCLSLLSHMEWMFYLLLFWMSLNVFLSKWSSAIKMHCKYCFVFACKPSLLTKGCTDERYTVVHHLGYKVRHRAQHQARLSNKVLHKKIYSLWSHLKCTTNAKKTQNANKGFKGDAGLVELYWQLQVEHCSCYVWAIDRWL